MILLDKPYVSEYLLQTIQTHSLSVLDTEYTRSLFPKENLCSTEDAIRRYTTDGELFYSNSENTIHWIHENMPTSHLSTMIALCKDKVAFRKRIQPLYPHYYFRECSLEELTNLSADEILYPVVLKPAVGFLSLGVYAVRNAKEWRAAVAQTHADMKRVNELFPPDVVDTTQFLIEALIEGEEYAVDAYFDANGTATILNIFHHPFSDAHDVSDRLYYTSKHIIETYLQSFTEVITRIGKIGDFRNFPFHIEMRVNNGSIIPIEMNPLRFCGWCITDIAYHAWGINSYTMYCAQQQPDWKTILAQHDESMYYFAIAEIPTDIDKDAIRAIHYEPLMHIVSHPLELRKIDYRNNAIFAIVFARTDDSKEIDTLLHYSMKNCIEIQ